MQPLGNVPGGSGGIAYGVSAVGDVVVGSAFSSAGRQAFRWTADTGMVARTWQMAQATSLILNLAGVGSNRVCMDWGGGNGLFCRMMRDQGFNFISDDKYAEPFYSRGFTREAVPAVDGTPLAYVFYLDDGTTFAIENYHLSVPAHTAAFAAAGLRDLRWHPPRVAPDGLAQSGAGFWDDFVAFKPVICLECRK